ncbi:hypothetical protein BGZ98_007239 [Dissophora globulifera]|nr:hypothetical protein BGZ98_007239 [Dissophora globulifera]
MDTSNHKDQTSINLSSQESPIQYASGEYIAAGSRIIVRENLYSYNHLETNIGKSTPSTSSLEAFIAFPYSNSWKRQSEHDSIPETIYAGCCSALAMNRLFPSNAPNETEILHQDQPTTCDLGKVHGSLARAGKVKSQTPKVAKQEKKKKLTGRAKKRDTYKRRFINVTTAPGGKRRMNVNPESSKN